MAKSGFKHIDVGVELTKTEWESEETHELLHGNSFPSSPVERQLFYRDDEHKWYIYNASTWVWLGGGGGGMSVHGNEYHDPDFAEVSHTHSQLHDRQHAVTSSSDHTSPATPGKMLKADANGLPVNATNTDIEVSDAVTKKHAQLCEAADFTKLDGIEAGADVTANHNPKAHKTSHQDGGADEISVAGLSGLLADGQTPLAHKTSHQDGGSDEISLAGLDGEPSTLTTHKNATTGVHGVGAGTIAKVGDIAIDSNLSAAAQDAISKKHTQSHAITSTSDHTSSATSGKMLKADANGLPVNATNTDTEVADAVTKKQSKVITLTFLIDGGGSAITTGQKGHLEIPFACTITGWTLLADQSGSIVIDVWKDTYANFPPTVADTIAGSEKPTLSSQQKNQDLTLTTWTTAVAAGDILAFNVDSVSTVTRAILSIRAEKN
jgi:hypothetical protein